MGGEGVAVLARMSRENLTAKVASEQDWRRQRANCCYNLSWAPVNEQ